MTSLLDDVRFGLRLLARTPGSSAIAVATLAPGIGLNAAMFSLVQSALLPPLPYCALGAHPAVVLAIVLWKAAAMSVAGILLGTPAGLALTRLLSGLLYEVRSADPATFALVAAAVWITSMAAEWWPARRAARLDPALVLREE